MDFGGRGVENFVRASGEEVVFNDGRVDEFFVGEDVIRGGRSWEGRICGVVCAGENGGFFETRVCGFLREGEKWVGGEMGLVLKLGGMKFEVQINGEDPGF